MFRRERSAPITPPGPRSNCTLVLDRDETSVLPPSPARAKQHSPPPPLVLCSLQAGLSRLKSPPNAIRTRAPFQAVSIVYIVITDFPCASPLDGCFPRGGAIGNGSYSNSLGIRGVDLLHVGIAMTLGTTRFLTFDTRQVELANAAGLQVKV